jgi:hypothetical protein
MQFSILTALWLGLPMPVILPTPAPLLAAVGRYDGLAAAGEQGMAETPARSVGRTNNVRLSQATEEKYPNVAPDRAIATGSEDVLSPQSICLLLAQASLENNLPIDFFTRLIWHESHFNSRALSRAGARGIAQFIPLTAAERGLADPYDPRTALPAAGKLLRDLRRQFGNLGLAAAAYNAGAARVTAWLGGAGALPRETRAYVEAITGVAVREWVGAQDRPEHRLGSTISCDAVAKLLLARHERRQQAAAPKPKSVAAEQWILQIAAGSTREQAFAGFEALQKNFPGILGNRHPLLVKTFAAGATWYVVRVAESTRSRAKGLCARLKVAGGHCIVFSVPRTQ